jgi:hypothetical protein
LKREEVTSLLKDIIGVHDGINEEAATLMLPPNVDDVLSHGYQLHYKLPASDNLTCVRPLVKEHDLVTAEELEKYLLVVYRLMEKGEAATQP